MDERSPLCINQCTEDEASGEFPRPRHQQPPPPPSFRGRRAASCSFANSGTTALLGDDGGERGLESSYRRLSDRKTAGYDAFPDQRITNSLEWSTSSNEFVSIQVRR